MRLGRRQTGGDQWPPRITVHYTRGKCFCGCDRQLGFAERGIAKQGARVVACITYLNEYARPAQQAIPDNARNLDAFIAEGEVFTAELADVVHGRAEAVSVDRNRLRDWLTASQRIERSIGVALLQQG